MKSKNLREAIRRGYSWVPFNEIPETMEKSIRNYVRDCMERALASSKNDISSIEIAGFYLDITGEGYRPGDLPEFRREFVAFENEEIKIAVCDDGLEYSVLLWDKQDKDESNAARERFRYYDQATVAAFRWLASYTTALQERKNK